MTGITGLSVFPIVDNSNLYAGLESSGQVTVIFKLVLKTSFNIPFDELNDFALVPERVAVTTELSFSFCLITSNFSCTRALRLFT
jgi:hypothetical protein